MILLKRNWQYDIVFLSNKSTSKATISGNTNLKVGEKYTDPGYNVYDSVDADLKSKVKVVLIEPGAYKTGFNQIMINDIDNNIKIGVLSNKPDEFIEDILNMVYPEIKFELTNNGKTIVLLLADTGERYLSSGLFE